MDMDNHNPVKTTFLGGPLCGQSHNTPFGYGSSELIVETEGL